MRTRIHRVLFSIFFVISIFVFGAACTAPTAVSKASLPVPLVQNSAPVRNFERDLVLASGIVFISFVDPEVKQKHGGNCTGFAFAKNGDKYLFLTAAHCVSEYNKDISANVFLNPQVDIVLETPSGNFRFHKAKVLAVGYEKTNEDFSILEIETDDDIPVMPLAKIGPSLNEDILLAASPLGASLGVLSLKGYVSKEKFINLVTSDGTKANNSFGIQVIGLGRTKGFSGAGVFGVKTNAIVGVAVAILGNETGHVTLVVISIEKFNSFYKEYLEGKRPLIKPPKDANQKKPSVKK